MVEKRIVEESEHSEYAHRIAGSLRALCLSVSCALGACDDEGYYLLAFEGEGVGG